MALLYTGRQRQMVLQSLRIEPIGEGLITSKEAAAILTWRAKEEHGIVHEYHDGAVRRHVESGNLKVIKKKNKVVNLFGVEDVFKLPLRPSKGIKKVV